MTEQAETYDGHVVFVQGVHYPADDDGHADLDRPLRWVEGSTYRDAVEGEPLHDDVHHARTVDLEVAGTVIEVADQAEADAVLKFLAQRRGDS